jgi:serine/threonine protein kinase
MARIYIARSTGIGSFERHVVLKMILPERAHDETSVQMFLDEARLAASLNHQNVAQVFEVGEEGGIHFLAMEYVHGQDLRALLAKAGSEGTRVPLELALTVVAGAASGLHHAHERRTSDGTPMGIVHRDVSPSNIMIGYDGAVKLLDFGIAKATMRSVETQSGIIKGKFAYMAPEQCRGRDVDRRSDVFSLGIILYEVTTQHRCFRADSDFDTMHRIVTGDVVRPTRLVQGYPQALEAIVMQALAVDASQRYQSAAHLLEAIEGFAIATRMSLSTMSLGRFMRDMFGDVQEPWLEAGRLDLPAQRREQTISNTNASGGQPPAAGVPPYHGDAVYPEEPPLHLSPGSSLLDLPENGPYPAPYPVPYPVAHVPDPLPEVPDEDPRSEVERSARSYAALAALYAPAAAAAAEVERDARLSSPNLPPMPPQLPSSAAHAMGMAGGSQPMLPLSFAAPSGPGSGSAPAVLPLGSQPIASTRRGYTGAPGTGQSESSYPLYVPPPDADLDVDLQPNRRLLYIGIGIALVGIIVLLAISIADNDDVPTGTARSTLAPSNTTSPGSAAVATPDRPSGPAQPAGASGSAPALPGSRLEPHVNAPIGPSVAVAPDAGVTGVSGDLISLHVVSTPEGAEVLLAGQPIGVTPLDLRLKRATGYKTLTIRRARFVDATTSIDLSGDCNREIALVPVPGESTGRPPGAGREPRPPAGREHPDRPTGSGGGRPHPQVLPPAPPPSPGSAKPCQDPGQINPFDKSCDGQACPPCPSR